MVVGEMIQEKQVVVIGGGPAGYTAAIRAAQLGKEVMLIEKNKLGGICLNEGCIPSKTMTHAAAQLKHTSVLAEMGIQMGKVEMDFQAFRIHRDKVVEQLRKGIEVLCRENKIEVMNGNAFFLEEDRIGVERGQEFDVIQFEKAIIAAGAVSSEIKHPLNRLLGPEQLFNLKEIPASILLEGKDYFALEAAFAYSSLGSDVTILLKNGDSLPVDQDIEKEIIRQLKKRKIKLLQGITDLVFADREEEILCEFVNNKKESISLAVTYAYKGAEWKGNTGELGLNRIGLLTDGSGFISVDPQGRTNLPAIFAAGDVTGGPLLAVKGMRQGKTAAESICGIPGETDFTWLPKVIHTDPPIASAGMTEKEAAEQGYFVQCGQYRFNGNGFAVLTGRKEGLVKMIKDQENGRILGMHVMGEGAVELISSGVIGGELVARDEDYLFPTYPHPSMNEGILEAIEDMAGLSIHQKPRRTEQRIKS